MSKESGMDFLVESWKKELANKNFDELVEIVAHKERFNPEFVEMAKLNL